MKNETFEGKKIVQLPPYILGPLRIWLRGYSVFIVYIFRMNWIF